MRKISSFICIVANFAVFGCATNSGVPAPIEMAAVQPHVQALSTYSSRLGRAIEIYGSDFPDVYKVSQNGIITDLPVQLELVFQGSYDAADGSSTPINQAFAVERRDSGTLRWTGFGPYRVPFGNEDKIGTFYGTVGIRQTVQHIDGTDEVVEDPQPLSITFDVEPSLVVREFQPITASCAGPAKRAIGGAPYRLGVEAIGFSPETFTYSIATPEDDELLQIPVTIRHIAQGSTDMVGADGELIMPNVPSNVKYYPAIVSITAVDAGGRTLNSNFSIGVHRPLEIFYNGAARVAEIYEAQPVSGCIPGGEAGRRADWSESETESETRSYSVNWNESWLDSHTVSDSTTQQVGSNVTNGIGFGTSNGQDFRFDVGTEFGDKAEVPLLVEASFGVRLGQSQGASSSVNNSANRSEGLSQSTTTTDSESETESYTEARGNSFSWSVSSSETISQSFGGTVIARTFGVFYRQKYRIRREALMVAYNLCGEGEVVGEVDFTDWTWSPDLSLGNACPAFPETNLPPAQCLLSPCGPAAE